MQETQEHQLVSIFDGNAVTNTLILAEGTENDHASVIKLVRKYQEDLSYFGEIGLQIRFNSQGKNTEFAYLNEPQATLLMTYMSNTPIIREFKKRLVSAFFELSANAGKPTVTFNINYKLDLAKLCEKQPVLGATLIQKVTGHDLSGIIKDMKLKESGGQPDLPGVQ